MAKMTKSQIAATLADKAGIKKKQVVELLANLAALAHKEAKKNGVFVVPDIGKLVLVDRPARQMVMRFGPKAGQTITVAAKKVVKFRVAKAAKIAIVGK